MHLIVPRAPQVDAPARLAHRSTSVRLERGVAVLLLGPDGEGARSASVVERRRAAHQGLRMSASGSSPTAASIRAWAALPSASCGAQRQVHLRILADGEAVDGRVQRQALRPERTRLSQPRATSSGSSRGIEPLR